MTHKIKINSIESHNRFKSSIIDGKRVVDKIKKEKITEKVQGIKICTGVDNNKNLIFKDSKPNEEIDIDDGKARYIITRNIIKIEDL